MGASRDWFPCQPWYAAQRTGASMEKSHVNVYLVDSMPVSFRGTTWSSDSNSLQRAELSVVLEYRNQQPLYRYALQPLIVSILTRVFHLHPQFNKWTEAYLSFVKIQRHFRERAYLWTDHPLNSMIYLMSLMSSSHKFPLMSPSSVKQE